MSSNPNKPPLLREGDSYENWKKLIKLWRKCTNIPKEGQAPAVVLTLDRSTAAGAAALKLDVDELAEDDGMDKLITALDGVFIQNTDQEIYHSYHNFEQFKRTEDMMMTDYLVNFDLLYDKAKSHGNVLTQSVLAYRLLTGACLNEEKQSLIRATCTRWEYDVVKVQLRKVSDEISRNCTLAQTDSYKGSKGVKVKTEPDEIMLSSLTHLLL